jgi:hypothetical protein
MAKFIYEEISEWNVNKSGNSLYIYASKVEKYHLQFISSLAGVKIKWIRYTPYTSSTYSVFSVLATKTYFDPAYWEYEGAQAKIVANYPGNELKTLWEEPLPSRNRNTTELVSFGFLDTYAIESFWQIFYLRLLLDFLVVNFAYSMKNFYRIFI